MTARVDHPVLPDANDCYPISLLDVALVLKCDEASLHSVLVTEDLLGEFTLTSLARRVRSTEAAERFVS